jgi:hypothetical protein
MLGPLLRRLKTKHFLRKNAPHNVLMHAGPRVKKAEKHAFSREKNAPPNVLLHAWPLVKTAEIHAKTQCFLEKIAPPNVLMHAWPLVKKAENHVVSRAGWPGIGFSSDQRNCFKTPFKHP